MVVIVTVNDSRYLHHFAPLHVAPHIAQQTLFKVCKCMCRIKKVIEMFHGRLMGKCCQSDKNANVGSSASLSSCERNRVHNLGWLYTKQHWAHFLGLTLPYKSYYLSATSPPCIASAAPLNTQLIHSLNFMCSQYHFPTHSRSSLNTAHAPFSFWKNS